MYVMEKKQVQLGNVDGTPVQMMELLLNMIPSVLSSIRTAFVSNVAYNVELFAWVFTYPVNATMSDVFLSTSGNLMRIMKSLAFDSRKKHTMCLACSVTDLSICCTIVSTVILSGFILNVALSVDSKK